MARKTNDGGPAFPGIIGPPNEYGIGMSIRDWFAGKALAGMLASERANDEVHYREDIAADRAYRLADGMLAARKAGA